MGTNERRSCSVIMDNSKPRLKILTLAMVSAAVAACGERGGDEKLDAKVEPAPEDKPEMAEAAPGEWFYKDSNGYPWAGFGPPRSEALFVIACRQGQVVFQHANRDVGEISVEFADGAQTVMMEANGDGLPMSEGALPANDPFIHKLAQSQGPLRVFAGGRAMTMQSDVSYRRVARSCIDGV
ncbi:hypothetical protein [Hyphococcus sp.]|uniref:hypothetical protein n=1 Tax=Hyphococcus sp. TaxID=2038636 RepID=UPI0035C7580A